ncbi:hypothetical protein F5878DRAFT_709603 [Lentinula raphanica]|uniref:Transmembrane protein n=1 Tax=Lentinula raphanica TaxID=153919 RepID=A0AA38PAA5_9AGAR|nr:hypothetical protein F5878DRAFT_709603 [Lentinula raphanica]
MTRPGHIRVLPLGILLLSSLMSTISPEVLAAPTSVVKLRRDLGREDSKVRPEVSGVLPHPVEARGGSAGAGAGGSRSEEVEVEAAIDQQTQARRREVLFDSFLVPRADELGNEHENHVPPQNVADVTLRDQFDQLLGNLTEVEHRLRAGDRLSVFEHEERMLRYSDFCDHERAIRSMYDQLSDIREEAIKAGDESLEEDASQLMLQLTGCLEAFVETCPRKRKKEGGAKN